jgi:hypothetical protein
MAGADDISTAGEEPRNLAVRRGGGSGIGRVVASSVVALIKVPHSGCGDEVKRRAETRSGVGRGIGVRLDEVCRIPVVGDERPASRSCGAPPSAIGERV